MEETENLHKSKSPGAHVDAPVTMTSAKLTLADRMGSWKMRWAIGRDHYRVEPGLYGIGKPDRDSEVLVTANYKMTFDRLRQELAGIDAWILVLDTKGVNVWCAAGKGTFGTQELIDRLQAMELDRRVNHRRLILPQLGAVGVAAHDVQKATGFRIEYGPVRARDIRSFLAAGRVKTTEMKQVRFGFMDRLVLAPAELVFTFKPMLITFGVLFILNALRIGSFGLIDLVGLIGAVIAGTVLVPVLLPLIPGRAFALKGAELGVLWVLIIWLHNGWPSSLTLTWLRALAYLFVLPSVSAFSAMNFTGSTTYTSPSGVNREMRRAIPVMVIAAAIGLLFLLGEMIFG